MRGSYLYKMRVEENNVQLDPVHTRQTPEAFQKHVKHHVETLQNTLISKPCRAFFNSFPAFCA